MPTTKVTEQKIQQVAEDLVNKGFIPTQNLIRKQLGKGSYSTVQKYLLNWKQVCFKQYVQSKLI